MYMYFCQKAMWSLPFDYQEEFFIIINDRGMASSKKVVNNDNAADVSEESKRT